MPNQQTLRTFIAITPEQQLAQQLVSACDSIKKHIPDSKVHWIGAKNLHVTLRFLGNLTPKQIADLYPILTEKLQGYRAFEVPFEQIRWFPSARHPRVIAATFKSSPELHALALRVELAARAIGLEPEKRAFRGHLTLARYRAKGAANFNLDILLENLQLPIKEITLFRSELTQKGPIYNVLKSIPLS